MRLTKTSSRWGNLYRFRFFIDGKRVSKNEFERIFSTTTESQRDEAHCSKATEFGWRDDWEF